jgi:hypothetical protein
MWGEGSRGCSSCPGSSCGSRTAPRRLDAAGGGHHPRPRGSCLPCRSGGGGGGGGVGNKPASVPRARRHWGGAFRRAPEVVRSA